MSPGNPVSLAFARNAMATRFEIILNGADPVSLRAAAEAAFDEIERLEAQLSLFRPPSEIARVNARAAHEPVRVSPETFHLLEHAAQLTRETRGAFDITIAPLLRAWGFLGGNGHLAQPEGLAAARNCVGMNWVELNASTHTVHFARPGVMLDLGAIGKGYAVGCAVALLRDLGITSGLIHGGTSTAYAIGCPPDASAWKIAVNYPRGADESAPPLLAHIELCDQALSMSAGWGKSFRANGREYGHVIDARTGEPADHALLAVLVTSDATESDALSTALLTLGPAGLELISTLRPSSRALVVANACKSEYQITSQGVAVQAQAAVSA